MWYMHDGWGWWMVFGGLWALAFWVLLIALVVWVVKRMVEHRGPGAGTPEKRDPMDIAKERYAKGEISKEQFEQIKKDLHSS